MPSYNYLTLHILNALPLHNLNRDDRGMPKSLVQGGANRGMLSSQSLKRAARKVYEDDSHDISLRSAKWLAQEVASRVAALRPELGDDTARKDVVKRANVLIGALTASAEKAEKKKAEAKEGEEVVETKDTSTWLSEDEINQIATTVINDIEAGVATKAAPAPIGQDRTTGSLAIAAFGRMFAAAADRQTVSAVAVSPATTTHPISLVNDYFTTVDDLGAIYDAGNAGAAYLDTAAYTSGVYYRTVTIDRAQLHRSWSKPADDDQAHERVAALVRALIYGVPSGKKQSTGTGGTDMPVLVLAEEQRYRTAYGFDQPIALGKDGGYSGTSIARLYGQRAAALDFDGANFGRATLAGTQGVDGEAARAEATNLSGLIDHVVSWVFHEAIA
ncbi:MAG: type I-E CRISPR-associated protein Cas7/Cse4/CasC [Micrococcales bacterium]|nr:type I-E CRISPR-associated protein Cas7/Cse4/CasC [Micrococcales bacterium]